MKDEELMDKPYKVGISNNRKKTLGRLADDKRERIRNQSIPIYDKKSKKLLGYKHLYHDKV